MVPSTTVGAGARRGVSAALSYTAVTSAVFAVPFHREHGPSSKTTGARPRWPCAPAPCSVTPLFLRVALLPARAAMVLGRPR